MTGTLDIIEKAVEQFFIASIFIAQGLMCTVVYNAVEYVIFDQIWTAELHKEIE